MGDSTKIEWTDATWNPVTGCAKVSKGCKHCYAERDWARLVHLPAYKGRAFTDVACHSDRLDQPLRWTKPRMIFVNSMSDLFHPAVPDKFIDLVFAVMAACRQHTFQVLTKRSERMRDYLNDSGRRLAIDYAARQIGIAEPFTYRRLPLPNVWIGVSVEDQTAADERIPLLLQTPAAVRWISAEPLLGPVDLRKWINDPCNCMVPYEEGAGQHSPSCATFQKKWGLDWIVVGGESGPKARPMHPAWARSLRNQCAEAGVPFLFKQWGEWAPTNAEPVREQYTGGALFLRPDGTLGTQGEWWDGSAQAMDKTGKKAAGRLLDGVQHDGYPVDCLDAINIEEFIV